MQKDMEAKDAQNKDADKNDDPTAKTNVVNANEQQDIKVAGIFFTARMWYVKEN